MKIRISMPGAYMVMDMEEGQARTAAKKAGFGKEAFRKNTGPWEVNGLRRTAT